MHTPVSSKINVKEEIYKIVGNQGVAAVVDSTGVVKIIEQAYEITSPYGRTILVGVQRYDGKISIYPFPLHFGKVLTGSHGGESNPSEDIPRYTNLIKSGRVKFKKMITHRFTLDEINYKNTNTKSYNTKNHLKYLKSVSSTLFSEIQKRSVLILLKITGRKLYNIWENRAPWPVKIRFWCHLMRLIFVPIYKKKRVLGIWDYKALPWSVGDTLVFIEKLSILKIQHNAEEIDICIVYDRENPGGNRRGSNLTPENAQDYMLDFLPLFSTCPYLGSIYQFNSRNEYYQFLKNNIERYNIFPSFGHHLAETYNYNKGEPHLNEIQEFYNTHGYIPYLRIGVRDNYWAQWFYLNYLSEGKIPVTLTLRQLVGSPERNADPSVWLSFIDKCKTNFPEVIFVFIGLREEVFEGLRAMQNVIIAKDFGSTIIEDLALIRASIMYMGTTSGVNIIAQFSDLPHLIFQFPNIHKYGLNLGDNFSFATDRQKIFSSTIKITPELLFNEFKDLYSKLDRNKWRSLALENARIKHGHPSAVVEKKD